LQLSGGVQTKCALARRNDSHLRIPKRHLILKVIIQQIKNETAKPWHRFAVSHFQIRDGDFRGMGLPLSSCPHLKAETFSSPLYLETMALMLWIIPGAAPRRRLS